MNPQEIIIAAHRAGLTLTIRDETLVITGTGPRPTGVLEAIRTNKSAVMSALQAHTSEECEKSEKSNAEAQILTRQVPLPDQMPQLMADERRQVIERVMGLGKPATGWCLVRANAYFEKFPNSTWEEQDAAAARDFLSAHTPSND